MLAVLLREPELGLTANPFRARLLAALVSLGLSLVIYAGGLGLPFYSDDLLQVPWAKSTSLPDIWGSANPYHHYRPLQFTIWHLLYLATGDLSPLLLHALNLLGHAVGGLLLGCLLSREEPWWLVAPLASALFVAFPFAFDVVLWPCSFAYPLAVGLTLGAVLVYLRSRRQASWSLGLLGVAMVALAGFSHEIGVAAGAAVVWAEICLFRRHSFGWAAANLLASVVPAALVLRFSQVSTRASLGSEWSSDLVVGLQALAYPVAPAATVGRRLGLEPSTSMLWGGILALVVLAWLSHRGQRGRWFWLGLGWGVGWAAIPLFTQQFDWQRDPPRVLYANAVGAGVAWAAGLASLFPQRSAAWAAARAGLALALLVVPVLFLWGRLEVYRQGGGLLWEVVRAADEGPGAALFVNIPGRITPQRRWYPLGHEGFIPLPPPTDVDALIRAHGGQAGRGYQRSAGGIMPLLPYGVEIVGGPLTMEELRRAERVYVASYRPDGIRLELAGGLMTASEAEPAEVGFGPRLTLLSARCQQVAEGRVELSLRWRALEPIQGDPTVFAHLLAANGSLLAQADGYPVGGLYPFSQWRQGEEVLDRRVFWGFAGTPTTVVLGVWEPATGDRLSAVSAGEALADDAYGCVVESP